ncbi:MAG: 4-hydroxythreonine-4-phosphate dehydrogenase PdxA [Candidatus Xenobiia bacterium LiM19]
MNPILISTGDPAGIGPEITIKAMMALHGSSSVPLIPVCSGEVLSRAASFAGCSLPLFPVSSLEESPELKKDKLCFIDIEPQSEHAPAPGEVSSASGLYTMATIRKTVQAALRWSAAVVTAPIHKVSLSLAGWSGGGHTELLTELAGGKDVDTVFCLEKLKVFFLTRHISLREAVEQVTGEHLLSAIERTARHMSRIGIARPRIGIPGLNPHCSDGGLFGREEEDEITPAVVEAQKKGIDARGPVGADSIYHLGFEGHYDAIISLYHDQGHIALKTRDFYGTVTMTLGLPFLRTSVDHGTAHDIAWQGKASERSLIKAIELAAMHLPVIEAHS